MNDTEKISAARRRTAEFDQPLPVGWRPSQGDIVYVRPGPVPLSHIVSTGVVTCVLKGVDDTFRVLLQYRQRQSSNEWWSIVDLRPYGDRI